MSDRPGSRLAQRPLHFIVLADCSGSMAIDGKMQALNNALQETIPHLEDAAAGNPHAEVLARVIAFSTGARWHIERPTPVEQLAPAWVDLDAVGYTDLGAAIDLLTAALRVPPMEPRSFPPVVVLISDGMPTDDYRAALGRLLDEPWGQRAIRAAVGIGREVDETVLARFTSPGVEPLLAFNPEQLVRMIRWVSMHASKASSTPAVEPRFGVPAYIPIDSDSSELTWE